jgi:unspecific monooxygenase
MPPALAAERLGDQIATMVVAGHETTAAAVFWTLYLLAKYPREQERLAAEIMPLGLAPDNAAELLPQLIRTRAVVDESLRLYPPAFVIVRQALDQDDAAGVLVAKGSLVLIAPWIIHRHRRFWPAPDRFDPSRFMPDAVPPPRFAYLPFGAGPRICVGSPFALTELVLIVASLVRAFRIELASHRLVTPVGLVTLQPDVPPPFRLTPRAAG